MLTFIYHAGDTNDTGVDDDDATASTCTDDEDMYTAIALEQLCLTAVL